MFVCCSCCSCCCRGSYIVIVVALIWPSRNIDEVLCLFLFTSSCLKDISLLFQVPHNNLFLADYRVTSLSNNYFGGYNPDRYCSPRHLVFWGQMTIYPPLILHNESMTLTMQTSNIKDKYLINIPGAWKPQVLFRRL